LGQAPSVTPLRRLAWDVRSSTAFEYALIASVIAVAGVIVISNMDINVDAIPAAFTSALTSAFTKVAGRV